MPEIEIIDKVDVPEGKLKTKKHKCPPHHWMLDEYNIGRCRYCPAVKDFGALMQKQPRFLKRLESEVT